MNYSIFQNRFLMMSALLILMYSCNAFDQKEATPPVTKSEIRITEEGHRIFLNGEPFYVKGAGVGSNGSLELLSKHGANSFRTWSTDNGKEVLDQAEKLGLKVMMGIWVGLERHGFDYDNKTAVRQQFESIRKSVMELKDHPALMVWGIGNEMNLLSKNPKVWDAVNEISEMIHELDPNHLTTTSLSGIEQKDVDLIAERAPNLDFISVQVYGAIEILPELIEKSGYEGGVLVTEWGATGYWEVGKTEWGAPMENNSSVKADLYGSRYKKSILSEKQIMGSFVFLWGQKQERTPTWFGMFMPDGNETESIDMMHYVWNGDWPTNRSPRLIDFTIEGKRAVNNIKLKAGEKYKAQVEVKDPDNDKLTYHWEIMRESESTKTGGDPEYIPSSIDGAFSEKADGNSTFLAPEKPGAYRLFINVDDGHNHSAHANIPFWVED